MKTTIRHPAPAGALTATGKKVMRPAHRPQGTPARERLCPLRKIVEQIFAGLAWHG